MKAKIIIIAILVSVFSSLKANNPIVEGNTREVSESNKTFFGEVISSQVEKTILKETIEEDAVILLNFTFDEIGTLKISELFSNNKKTESSVRKTLNKILIHNAGLYKGVDFFIKFKIEVQ